MVEIQDDERPFLAVRVRDPQVREYLRQLNDRVAKKDRGINALRKDVHMVATAIRLHTSSPSQDRYRLPSLRRADRKNAHVKDCHGKRVDPYDEKIPSLSLDRSQAWGDVKDRLARPKENHRREVQEESFGSFYNLAYPASHETAIDQQQERQYRKQEERARHRDWDRDRYYCRERSPSQVLQERRRHRDEVYERRPSQATDPLVVVTPKAPQTKVEMVLEQLGLISVYRRDPLHELLKKIEQEPYFSYPADDIPCPKPKDNKYRCSYHAKRGHLTTWCPQSKEYLQDLVRKGHLSRCIDQEKTKEKAGEPKTARAGGLAVVG
ncbi:hypothetical protein RHSIM_Rhsim12G0093000 [Rhododendron simsii]|uniref:Uncharacterized protein n=1 Tax=Rhododendron simsii TaxID=118357 RepID=A0A834G4V5_RHOSS|nr:hypothetical protein RHSIM_Rhsim12G0093000 [Rhododendron simsii]